MYKSVYYTGYGNDLVSMREALNKESTTGYCTMTENSLYRVQNLEQCEEYVPYPKSPERNNIGYYYRVTFPVGQNGFKFTFHLKNPWSRGGAVLMDGEEIYNSPDPLDVTNMLELEFTLMSGNHVFEGFGSGSGDERGKWSFLVNNGESLVVRTRDLDTYG